MLDTLSQMLSTALSHGSVAALGLAFLLGLAVGFSPCVYPVLPLTVAYIAGISKGRKLNGFLYSLVYVLGMAIVYCTIGVISAIAGGELRMLWGNPWVILAFANFFLLLALWQLGVIRIRLPQWAGGERKGGLLGALAVGAASGLIVGPCTVPGLAAMLALINASAAHTGQSVNLASLLFGVVAMFAYSLGLGSLIVICGTFSGVLANLPKSGRWLNIVEKAFAVIMILLAEYFLIYAGHSLAFKKEASTVVSPNSWPAQVLGVGQPAPDWTLEGLEEGRVGLSQFKGQQGVIMAFFATWCPACVDEVAQLKQFQASYDNRAVALLAINVAQPEKAIRAFVKEKGINYKVLLDENAVVSANYGVEVLGLPLVVGIGADGVVRYMGSALPKELDGFVASLEPVNPKAEPTRAP